MKRILFISILLGLFLNVNSQVTLQSKVFLNGCYNSTTGLMIDSLRWLNLIPLVSPYDGVTRTSTCVINQNCNNEVIDWVKLSIKSATNTYVKSCLLQRDGDIVDADGNSRITFAGAAATTYTVQVKHRNHLGCETAAGIPLDATSIPPMIDFTNLSTNLYIRPSPNNNPSPLTGATKTVGSVRTLYAGNCNLAGAYANFITYSNAVNSDRTTLFNYTGSTGSIFGYHECDCNMDGYARYGGLRPDRLTILANCNNNIPTGVIVNQQTSF